MRLRLVGIGVLVILLFSFSQLSAEELIAKADSIFELRTSIFDSNKILADSSNVNEAISIYKKIIDTSTDKKLRHEAAWKILQAYFFKGLFTNENVNKKVKIFSEAVKIGEKLINEFPESAAVNCWFGIVLGYLGEVGSKLNSLQNDIPARVKKIAEKVIALDKNYLDAGGYRMYGRLNYIVPAVPLVMSWPSKEKAVEYLEKAYEIAPENLFNKLYLAEALLDQKKKERAIQLLKSIIDTKEIRHDIAIDTYIKHKAKILLEKL